MMAAVTINAPHANRPAASQGTETLTNNAAQFQWASAALSNVGKVRVLNEDAYFDQPARGIWAVADGMGGHARGDLASRTVVEALNGVMPSASLAELIAAARERLQTANRQLRKEAAIQNVHIIGSTVVALLAYGRDCGCVWAGDSRIYLCRNGSLRRLTRDHSQLEELKARVDPRSDAIINHPARNLITRAVGAAETLDLDEETLEVNDGDMFLLCSDGLSNEVSEQDMRGALVAGNCRQAAEVLIEMALTHGGRDNVSVVVVRAEDLCSSDKTMLNPVL